MKARLIILAILSVAFSFANAQEVENDDMYFNSKDREKLKALNPGQVYASNKKAENRTSREEQTDDYNPTDSYSARNVNPEYTSRAQSQTAQEDNEDYFVNNYRYSTQSNFNRWNNNYNNWYNNPWYTSAYWGSSINRWNTPYYGSYYDAWGNPWNNPYYRSGWSTSFSYHWGSPWDYRWNAWNSWSMNYGWGGWYNPWNYYGPSFYNPYYGWYGYPSRVIVVNNDGDYRGPVYGKRNTRSSNVARDYNQNGNRNNRIYTNTGSGSRSDNSGRVRTTSRQSNQQSTSQPEYYNRSWKSESQNSNSSYSNSNSSYDNNSGRTNSWYNTNNSNNSRSSGSSWRQSSNGWGGNSNSTYSSPSRSSGSTYSSPSGGSGGGSRSSRSSRGGN